MVQWLRFCTSTAGGTGSIPGLGTKIPPVEWHSQTEKEEGGGLNGGNPESLLEKQMATHSSILARRIPWTEKSGRLSPWGREELDMTEPLTHT